MPDQPESLLSVFAAALGMMLLWALLALLIGMATP